MGDDRTGYSKMTRAIFSPDICPNCKRHRGVAAGESAGLTMRCVCEDEAIDVQCSICGLGEKATSHDENLNAIIGGGHVFAPPPAKIPNARREARLIADLERLRDRLQEYLYACDCGGPSNPCRECELTYSLLEPKP